MAKCFLHPGRSSVGQIFGQEYCQKCHDGITSARGKVDKHVEPKDCFVWYRANDDWAPITGTGCAHWVSHQNNVKKGTAHEKCLAGFTFRVKVTLDGKSTVSDVDTVKVGDWWFSDDKDHMGIVAAITKPAKATDKPKITIKHDSSAQGKGAENDWATYFHGKGKFCR